MELKNFPKEKYDIIVVDPPWPIKKLTHKARPNQTKMDYETMSLKDITDLPIQTLTTGNSWCFLWTTQKFLFGSKTILEKWGFHYLLCMTWKKVAGRSEGMPLFGFRWNSEFILVGNQSKILLWVKGKPLIKTCFEGINIRHSQKPSEFYEAITLLGKTRIDIFARNPRKGWDVWGNEISELPSQPSTAGYRNSPLYSSRCPSPEGEPSSSARKEGSLV